MSKSIKISEEVYTGLLSFQNKRETFSQTINRLLLLMEKMGELKGILEGEVKFSEWRKEQLEKQALQDR